MLLTSAQVAERLGISIRNLYRMVDRGQITPVRISARNFRFAPEELERFIADASDKAAS